MADIYRRHFAAAPLVDADCFSSTTGSGPDITWDSGTGYGAASGRVAVAMNDTTADFGVMLFGAALSGTDTHLVRWINKGTLAGSTAGQNFQLTTMRTSSANRGGLRVGVEAEGLVLIHSAYNDAGTEFQESILVGTSNWPEWFELHLHRATNATSSDGYSKLYFGGGVYSANGELVSTHSGIDNFDMFITIDRTRDGCTNIGSGFSGTFYLDEMIQVDTDTAIFVNPVSPPTLSVPGDQTAKYGITKTISSITPSAGTGAIDQADLTCTAGMTITVVASGSANVTGNGTAAVQVTGTQVDVLATIASIDVDMADPGTSTWSSEKTVTVLITDDGDQTVQDTILVTWTPSAGVGTPNVRLTGTSAQVLDAISKLGWTPTTAGAASLVMYSATSTPLTDQDTFNFTVSAAGGGGGGGGGEGVSHTKLSHTVGLHL